MNLSDLSIDFQDIVSKQRSFPEQTAGVTQADIRGLTGQIYDRLDALTAGVTDAQTVFVALDPAQDNAPGWNLAHIILHITASLEEGMAQSSTLARGVDIAGRSRYEPDWETITTAAQIAQRLAESRRMSSGFLETWPDAPQLDNTHQHEFLGEMTPIAYAILSIYHGQGMLAQVDEILRQAKAV